MSEKENLTEKILIRLSGKDRRSLKYLAEKECLCETSLVRRIILLYLKGKLANDNDGDK